MASFDSHFVLSRHHTRAGREVQDLTHPFKRGLRKPDGNYKLDVPAPTPPPPPPDERAQPKSVSLATALAVVPGLGHIYLRQFVQGVAILGIVVAMLVLYFLIVPLFVGIFVWGWQIYNANRTAKTYNRIVADTGRRPW